MCTAIYLPFWQRSNLLWYQTLKIGLSSDVSDSSIYPIKTILRWDRLTTLKEVKNKIQREKRIAKIIFWCFTPFFFIAFFRFFFMILNFIYGTILRFIFGKKYGDIITVIAIFTALFFTVAVCSMLWKQYKKHILESWISFNTTLKDMHIKLCTMHIFLCIFLIPPAIYNSPNPATNLS